MLSLLFSFRPYLLTVKEPRYLELPPVTVQSIIRVFDAVIFYRTCKLIERIIDKRIAFV